MAGTEAAGPVVDTSGEVPLIQLTLWLCAYCIAGVGGECHSPGCALWMNRAPDLPITQHLHAGGTS